jgi:hypothetical protein
MLVRPAPRARSPPVATSTSSRRRRGLTRNRHDPCPRPSSKPRRLTSQTFMSLSAHLHFAPAVASTSAARSPLPQAGSSLLVTDTLAASADFVLLHLVAAQLKRGKQVVFVGLGEAAGHWRALGKKLVSRPLQARCPLRAARR